MALETILLAVGANDADRFERLAEETIDIGGPAGSSVVLAHAFTESEYQKDLDRLEFDTVAEEVTPDDVARRHRTIQELEEMLDEADLDVEIRGAVGKRGEEIVALAEDIDADLVIVGGSKRSPAGKAVFGSTAQKVMLDSPCPVTYVRADTK